MYYSNILLWHSRLSHAVPQFLSGHPVIGFYSSNNAADSDFLWNYLSKSPLSGWGAAFLFSFCQRTHVPPAFHLRPTGGEILPPPFQWSAPRVVVVYPVKWTVIRQWVFIFHFPLSVFQQLKCQSWEYDDVVLEKCTFAVHWQNTTFSCLFSENNKHTDQWWRKSGMQSVDIWYTTAVWSDPTSLELIIQSQV